ncbi:MAG: hypothetical protein IPG50_19475 [Myxococcales bacterium]|nr:hypothetical protein [Myxococcales bacterium]
MDTDALRKQLEVQASSPTLDQEVLGALVAQVAGNPAGVALLPELFKILETHPDDDFGMPGPLVHAAEKFMGEGYEEALVDSVQRSPNFYNLWMLNRVINGVSGQERARLLPLMQAVAARTDVKPAICKMATDFLKP